jgi:hypothetical protein
MHHENPRSESGTLVAVHLLTRIFGSCTVRPYLPYGLTKMRTWLCASASDATHVAIYRGKLGQAGAASSATRVVSALTQSREQTRLSTPVDGRESEVLEGAAHVLLHGVWTDAQLAADFPCSSGRGKRVPSVEFAPSQLMAGCAAPGRADALPPEP